MAQRPSTVARRLLAALLLAAYAPIGVVGYGLHQLWRCEHVGHDAACACDHGDVDCDRDELAATGESTSGDNAANVRHDSRADHCHDCAICSFLAQAQSASAPAVALAESQFVAAAPAHAESLVVLLRRAAALARGPPALS